MNPESVSTLSATEDHQNDDRLSSNIDSPTDRPLEPVDLPTGKPRTSPFSQFVQDVAHVYRGVTRSSVAVTDWVAELEPDRDDVSLTQQMRTMELVAENMLEKITCYCDVLEMLRGQTSEILNRSLPRTFEIIQQLEAVYAVVDRLEKMVDHARQGTLAMEEAMDRAEKELRLSKAQVVTSFLKKLSPFGSSGSAPEAPLLVYRETTLFTFDASMAKSAEIS